MAHAYGPGCSGGRCRTAPESTGSSGRRGHANQMLAGICWSPQRRLRKARSLWRLGRAKVTDIRGYVSRPSGRVAVFGGPFLHLSTGCAESRVSIATWAGSFRVYRSPAETRKARAGPCLCLSAPQWAVPQRRSCRSRRLLLLVTRILGNRGGLILRQRIR